MTFNPIECVAFEAVAKLHQVSPNAKRSKPGGDALPRGADYLKLRERGQHFITMPDQAILGVIFGRDFL